MSVALTALESLKQELSQEIDRFEHDIASLDERASALKVEIDPVWAELVPLSTAETAYRALAARNGLVLGSIYDYAIPVGYAYVRLWRRQGPFYNAHHRELCLYMGSRAYSVENELLLLVNTQKQRGETASRFAQTRLSLDSVQQAIDQFQRVMAEQEGNRST